jgi:hypothetical protein
VTQSLDASWDLLAHDGGATRGEFRVVNSGTSSAEGPALLAVDSQGLRHLLIPVRAGTKFEPDERSSGVRLSSRSLLDNGLGTSFVDVSCRKPHLFEVFRSLVAEVLETLVTEPGRPATVAQRVLNRWRELLDRDRPGILSDEELVGLFGELLILKQLVQRTPGAVSIWSGPHGARFDFQRSTVCLEVKSTTSMERKIVHVHGIDQLDPGDGFDLYLAVIGLERVVDAGISVPEILGEIRQMAVDSLELASRLASIGYSEHDEAFYRERRFSLRSTDFFYVDGSFPRIIRSSFLMGDVPQQIESVRYAVDLTSSPPVALRTEVAEGMLDSLSGP